MGVWYNETYKILSTEMDYTLTDLDTYLRSADGEKEISVFYFFWFIVSLHAVKNYLSNVYDLICKIIFFYLSSFESICVTHDPQTFPRDPCCTKSSAL